MAALNRLSALAVKNATTGKHYDGGGLMLRVDAGGSGRWVYRFRLHGRQREMGLGARDAVSLANARVERDRWRAVVAQGHDPIREREKEVRQRAMARPTLEAVASACFEARKATLKGDGKAGRWLSPLTLHVLPRLGKTPIEEVSQNDIRDALKPIWRDKAETARKAMNRLGIVIRHGAAMGLEVDLQATMKAKELLGAQDHKVAHIPSMPWRDVPAFVASLEGGSTVSECLLFIILTAGSRVGPARKALWSQFDLAARVWTVPGTVMKGLKDKTPDYRVPLSDGAMAVLERVKPLERDGLVFPSPKKGAISDMAMTKLMERAGLDWRPHGFRSSLREWAEHIGADFTAAEMCLAHAVDSKVVRAYRRDDLLEKRRVLLQRWSDHCAGKGAADVLALHGAS